MKKTILKSITIKAKGNKCPVCWKIQETIVRDILKMYNIMKLVKNIIFIFYQLY